MEKFIDALGQELNIGDNVAALSISYNTNIKAKKYKIIGFNPKTLAIQNEDGHKIAKQANRLIKL